MLQLEVGSVGRGASRRVDPGAGRPPGAGPHERRGQRAVGVDGEARHAAVEHRDGPVLEGIGATERAVDADLGVGEVVDEAADGRIEPRIPDNHEHRQRPQVTEIGRRHPHVGQRRVGRNPHAGSVFRAGEDGGAEHVVGGTTQRDPHVGQVRVDRQVAVAGFLGAGAGGRDTGARQRDHHLTCELVGGGPRRHDLGDRDRAHATVGKQYPHRRRHSEPAERRIVQCVGVFRGIDGPVDDTVAVRQAEAAPDDGVADLADGHRTGHLARPAQT